MKSQDGAPSKTEADDIRTEPIKATVNVEKEQQEKKQCKSNKRTQNQERKIVRPPNRYKNFEWNYLEF